MFYAAIALVLMVLQQCHRRDLGQEPHSVYSCI
jgi:hypothetical protein